MTYYCSCTTSESNVNELNELKEPNQQKKRQVEGVALAIQTAEGCVEDCPRSRGPHQTHRRKYKPGELSTAGLQCDYDADEGAGAAAAKAHETAEIQCDIEDDADARSVCSVCRCSSGFCNPKCEAAKVKMGKNRSEIGRPPHGSGIPVPVKRNSAPGLASLVAPPVSSCKCLGRCTRECEMKKMADAVAARKQQDSRKESAKKCAQNQCRSACNIDVQIDMDEPPISPLAEVPADGKAPMMQAQSEASSVCIACQCTGSCNVKCLMKRDGPLVTAEDLAATVANGCAVCECTGKCNPACLERKAQQTQSSAVCDACDCTGECTMECAQHKRGLLAKQSQTDADAPVCVCSTICQAECDQYKQTQTDQDLGVPQTSKAVVCNLCVCVGACNEDCLAAQKEKQASEKQASQKQADAGNRGGNQGGKPPPCDTCVCPNPCDTVCESTKSKTDRVCEDCLCRAACTAKCEERKKELSPQKVCAECQCCGVCVPDCEENKLKAKQGSKIKFDEDAIEAGAEAADLGEAANEEGGTAEVAPVEVPEDEPMEDANAEDTTQVRGIIEDFNDDDLLEQADQQPEVNKEKARSACNFPDDDVCTACICTDGCQSKCEAIRKIKSLSEFPPSNMVCDVCACVDKCTMACAEAKANRSCLTADGDPVKCDDDNPDWVPCVTCKDGKPCSKECRERMAQAFTMAKAPSEGAPEQCSEPCAADAQTSCAYLKSCADAQTTGGDHAVVQSTSTPDGVLKTSDLDKADGQEGDASDGQEGGASDGQETGTRDGPPPSGGKEDGRDDGPCTSDSSECGMCLKLRSYICSMFQNSSADGSNNNQATAGKQQMPEKGSCTCLAAPSKSEKQPPQKPPADQPQAQKSSTAQREEYSGDYNRICKCSGSLAQKKSSYTERMETTMDHLRAACNDAEVAASPFIKAQSVFTLDVGNQQEAISTLMGKCRQKDHYIDALIEDVLERSKSKVFKNLLCRLQDCSSNAPDFDDALICSALDKNKRNATVCGIDLSGFRVVCAKRVGATSIMIKWTPPVDTRICGYDIAVNGLMKTRICQRERVYTILDALDFSGTISIEIHANTPTGRASPPALAYYAKY